MPSDEHNVHERIVLFEFLHDLLCWAMHPDTAINSVGSPLRPLSAPTFAEHALRASRTAQVLNTIRSASSSRGGQAEADIR